MRSGLSADEERQGRPTPSRESRSTLRALDRSARALPDWFDTTSPDEAIEYCRLHCPSHGLRPARNDPGFSYQAHGMRLGPLTMMEVTYGSDVALSFDNLGAYKLFVPLHGELDYRHGDTEGVADERRATTLRPGERLQMHKWFGGTRVLAVKIDAAEAEQAARTLLGDDTDLSSAWQVAPRNETGSLRSFVALARAVNGARDVATDPMVAGPMVEGLVNAFLLATTSGMRRMTAPTRMPHVVRQAMEFVDENAGAPLTVADIAANCSVSVRTLQSTFAQHVGRTPMAYLRDVRLRHAHRDLCAADPMTTTVAQVAHRWGYWHLGRFSSDYRSAFGEPPSRTLRAAL